MSTVVDTLDVAPGAKPAAMLLDVRAVAALLNCSTTHVRRLADAGRMPRPLRVGALLRWREADLDGWIAAGCPSCSNLKHKES